MSFSGLLNAVFRNALPLVLAAALGCAAQAQDKPPVIRVAVEGAYPPFNYMDSNNQLQGFEVDLLKALCDAMHTTCMPVQHDWDGIIRGLLSHEYDAIMSSLEVNERRENRIAFSHPYYRVPVVFIGSQDSTVKAITPEVLAGLRIGTTERSKHAVYLEKYFKNAQVRLYTTLEEADLDLLTDRLDLVLGDRFALSKFLESREGACCRLIAEVPQDPPYSYQTYGIGLRKEDEALRNAFDKALDAIIADGTYERIRAAYFSFDIR